MSLSWLGLVVVALTSGGCGSENPAGPSASGGVAVKGVVLGEGASVSAADTSIETTKARKVTVKVEGTSLSVDVSANGTFQITGVPSGTFTLIFLADGVEVGRVVLSAAEGFEVKIVVQVTAEGLVVIEIKIEAGGLQPSPSPSPGASPSPSPTSSSCVVNGGRPGAGIELEGDVRSGSANRFELAAHGRSSVPVTVNASSASFTCVGSSKKTNNADCKASVTAGAKVHVRGTLMTCSSSAAEVTAIEVKVQKS